MWAFKVMGPFRWCKEMAHNRTRKSEVGNIFTPTYCINNYFGRGSKCTLEDVFFLRNKRHALKKFLR